MTTDHRKKLKEFTELIVNSPRPVDIYRSEFAIVAWSLVEFDDRLRKIEAKLELESPVLETPKTFEELVKEMTLNADKWTVDQMREHLNKIEAAKCRQESSR